MIEMRLVEDQPRAEYLLLTKEAERAKKNLSSVKERVKKDTGFFKNLFRSWMDIQWDIDAVRIASNNLIKIEKSLSKADASPLGLSGCTVIVKEVDHKNNLAIVRNADGSIFYYTEYSNLEQVQ